MWKAAAFTFHSEVTSDIINYILYASDQSFTENEVDFRYCTLKWFCVLIWKSITCELWLIERGSDYFPYTIKIYVLVTLWCVSKCNFMCRVSFTYCCWNCFQCSNWEQKPFDFFLLFILCAADTQITIYDCHSIWFECFECVLFCNRDCCKKMCWKFHDLQWVGVLNKRIILNFSLTFFSAQISEKQLYCIGLWSIVRSIWVSFECSIDGFVT